MALLSTTILASDADLTHSYPFNGNSNDAKGSANGTDTSIDYDPAYGKYAQGARFNAETDLIQYGAKLFGTGAKSFVIWYLSSSNTNDVTLYDDANHSSTNWGIDIDVLSTGEVKFWGFKTTAGVYNWAFQSTKKVNDGNWHHIACTWTGDTSPNGVKIYVDASLDGQATAATADSAASTNSNLRSVASHVSYRHDMNTFSKVLSLAEIQLLATDPVTFVGMPLFFR